MLQEGSKALTFAGGGERDAVVGMDHVEEGVRYEGLGSGGGSARGVVLDSGLPWRWSSSLAARRRAPRDDWGSGR